MMGRDAVPTGSQIADWPPQRVWKELEANGRSCLVDVRTKPEWLFVGVPDLSSIGRSVFFVEWNLYPGMEANASFCAEVMENFADDWPETVFFICRSGARSMAAARAFCAAARQSGKLLDCVNVAEGFEGDLDREFQRGRANGWKAKRLPWKQS